MALERQSKLCCATIGLRMNMLASMTILVVAILSFSYYYGDNIVNKDFQHQSDYRRLDHLVQQVEIGALRMRQREKHFQLLKDKASIDGYLASEKKVLHALEQAKHLPVASEVIKNINRLQVGIEQHQKTFLNVTVLQRKIGLDEKTGLQGQLRTAVHGVEKMIKAASHDGLYAKILMMRRHEKDFILRGKEKYIGRIEKRRVEFDELLNGTFFSAQKKAKFGTLMDAYQSGFKAYAEAALALKPETKKLDHIFEGLKLDFQAIAKIAKVGLEDARTSLAANRDFTRYQFLGSAVVALILALGLATMIGRSITLPIQKMTKVMQRLAQGDISVAIPHHNDKNEIGEMARAVLVFQKNAVQKQQNDEQKENDREQENNKRLAMETATNNFTLNIGTILETLTAVSTEQNSTANLMADISEKTSEQATSVSGASHQASVNVQAVATATEEMTSTIGEISEQVGQASNASRRAVEEVENTSGQMSELSETADKIGEVIELISSIAEQTNLLALNATIESARAGDAGKGFAVVAGEVKQLASQTAKATEEISQQIGDIQAASKRASDSMGHVAEAIKNVDGISTAIASAMEEQGAATQEIAENVHQAAAGTQQVNENIISVTEASKEAGAISERVLSTSGQLYSQVDELRSEVDRFIGKIQAA